MSQLETTQLFGQEDTPQSMKDHFDLPEKDPQFKNEKTVLFEDDTPEVQRKFREKHFEDSIESILSREGITIEDCFDPHDEEESFLYAPDMRSIMKLESGSSKYKKIAMYYNDQHNGIQVLEKPKAGSEFTRQSVHPDTFFKNSRTRYLFDVSMNKALNQKGKWNTVPTTIIQPSLTESKGFDIRSVAKWIPSDTARFLNQDDYRDAHGEFLLNIYRVLLAQLLLKEADACQHWMNMVGNPETGALFSIDNDQIGCDPSYMPRYEPHLVRMFHNQAIPMEILDEFQKFYHSELQTRTFEKKTERLMSHSSDFHSILMKDVKTILTEGRVLSSHELNHRRV